MPEYVLGNKAKKLYRYSKEATQPVPDDTVKAAGLPYRPKEEWDYAEGWVLKADVRHFFASIDHDLLKEKLARKIEDPKVYDLMCVYIDSTSGLPLGYQTSQLLALLFLDEFDHWVKEKLHAKYYGRYMDDFYIISDSKEFLQGCWRQINGRMDALKLELNEKTAIFPLRNGLNFLGFHTYLDNGGAVIMKLRQDSLDRMKARTRGWRKDKEAGTLDVARTVNRWKAWDAHAAHGDTFELRKQIAAIVSEITGVTCTARPPIRAGKYDKAKEAVRKVNRHPHSRRSPRASRGELNNRPKGGNTPMASAKLGTKAVGSKVKIKVSGTLRNFIVVHQGKPSSLYDASCDGTWLLMEDIYETRQWHSSNVNDYANSTIKSYLNSTWLNLIDANIRNQIKQVKIPYRPGSGTSMTVNSGSNGLSCKVFLLSNIEMGGQTDWSYMPHDSAKLAYFECGNTTSANNKRIAYLNGAATSWWSRSSYTLSSTNAWYCYSNGDCRNANDCSVTHGVRPAFILPSTLLVSDDGSVNTNTAPTTPGSITVPGTINGGSTITVQWAASSDAESNLEGYELERSTNGGSSWSNIYKGSARSTTNTVPFGTESVMYRVRAYDSEGLYSGYKSSSQVTVINNQPPSVPASITVPNEVLGGGSLTITWGVSTDSDGNLSGYALERQVDGGAWSEVFRGNALNFTDTITRGWASVAYRVRAYDARTAYSGYATSDTRTVNNNTPPAITCASPSGSDLGTKTEGFTVGYSVNDPDGDTITVKEKVDGAQKRSFTATPDAQNTLAVDGDTFMQLLNGTHALEIAASDGKATTTHKLTFTKNVTSAFVTLEAPMEADAPITICVLSVIGFIPADAEYTVEVTNNALDDTPAWEDCTTAVKAGANYIFENKDAPTNTPAFSLRINASRGPSGEGGYITSVQGGFQ